MDSTSKGIGAVISWFPALYWIVSEPAGITYRTILRILKKAVGRPQTSRLPWSTLILALGLVGVGALFITSAHSYALARKHVIFTGLGLLAFLGAAFFHYRHLAHLSSVLYAGGIISLALLPILGTGPGAQRWYNLRFFMVQPSQPMKLIVALALADYLSWRKKPSFTDGVLPALVIVAVPAVLIAIQPDLGTALLFVPLFVAVTFLAGVSLRHLLVVALAGAVLASAAWLTPGVMQDYQKKRVTGFIYPESMPRSSAVYNAEKATLAIASGGVYGRGWGEGQLSQLGRIPESHTDFIFAVIAEEWGFTGCVAIILAYLAIIGNMCRVTAMARDRFGRLLAGGTTALLASQVLLHVAINLRLGPITGLTLPLVSYGGSSLLTTFTGLGLVANVAMRKSFMFGPET